MNDNEFKLELSDIKLRLVDLTLITNGEMNININKMIDLIEKLENMTYEK